MRKLLDYCDSGCGSDSDLDADSGLNVDADVDVDTDGAAAGSGSVLHARSASHTPSNAFFFTHGGCTRQEFFVG